MRKDGERVWKEIKRGLSGREYLQRRDRRLQGTGEIKRKGNEHLFLVLDLGRGGAGLLLLLLLCRNI